MACSFEFGRLDMLLCQIPKSHVKTVHPVWFPCLPSHTDHEDTPNSFYSWVANIITEKPPIDERYAEVIEVMERQTPSSRKYSRTARYKRRGWGRCQFKVFFVFTRVIVLVCSKSPSLRRRLRRLHLHKRTESGSYG